MAITQASAHRLLVNALASSIAWNQGTVEEAEGFGALPKPRELNGHRPDLIARAPDGSTIIGEVTAHVGTEFSSALRRLLVWAESSSTQARLAVAVPLGDGLDAERAAEEAGWAPSHFDVVEVAYDR
jgi:hypothetical protein